MKDCSVCGGKGWVACGPQTGGDQNKRTCQNCGGTGKVPESDYDGDDNN